MTDDRSSLRRLVEETPMNWRQHVVIGMMITLNALDGFDVLSSAFASPGIAAEWGVSRDALGVVLSAELVGMGFGSILLGGLADKIGRKPTMIACLLLMALGMYLSHLSSGLSELTGWRLMTGLGIGGMLAATNAVTAESSSARGRSLAMALYVIGYPLGGVIGGFVAQGWLLQVYDWRAVFLFGAAVTAAMIPLVIVLVPETVGFLDEVRPKGALERVNRTLVAYGKSPVSELSARPSSASRPPVTEILSNPELRPVTLLLAVGFMAHTITFYYILKWAVKIVADYPPGHSPADAASVLTYANIGGAVGGLLFGFLMKRWGIIRPTMATLCLSFVAVAAFGIGYSSLWGWRMAAGLAMFFSNAAIVGYYATFADRFPVHARATGTGFVIGVGRAGAAASPIIAGLLFKSLGDDALLAVSVVMGLGSAVALALLIPLSVRTPRSDQNSGHESASAN